MSRPARLFLVLVSLSFAAPGLAQESQGGAAKPPAKPKAAKQTDQKTSGKASLPASSTPPSSRREGKIGVELTPDQKPNSVKNFVDLAEGKKEWTDPRTGQRSTKPLYDGTVFHRVIPGFMIQGGDPLGQGVGGPGYAIPDEIQEGERFFDKPCQLAYANSGPNTNGSQFFITEVPTLAPERDEVPGAQPQRNLRLRSLRRGRLRLRPRREDRAPREQQGGPAEGADLDHQAHLPVGLDMHMAEALSRRSRRRRVTSW